MYGTGTYHLVYQGRAHRGICIMFTVPTYCFKCEQHLLRTVPVHKFRLLVVKLCTVLPDPALLIFAGRRAPIVVEHDPSDDARGRIHVPQLEPYSRVVLDRLLQFHNPAWRVPVLANRLQIIK